MIFHKLTKRPIGNCQKIGYQLLVVLWASLDRGNFRIISAFYDFAFKWMLRKGIFFLSLQTHASLSCHKAKSMMINALVKTFLHIIWKTLDTQNNRNLWIIELEKLRRSVLPFSILTGIPAVELRTVGHSLLPAGLATMTTLLHREACFMLPLQEQSYSQKWAETGF